MLVLASDVALIPESSAEAELVVCNWKGLGVLEVTVWEVLTPNSAVVDVVTAGTLSGGASNLNAVLVVVAAVPNENSVFGAFDSAPKSKAELEVVGVPNANPVEAVARVPKSNPAIHLKNRWNNQIRTDRVFL